MFTLQAKANSESKPLWDYGLGLGLFQIEQYPASNQTTNLFLIFPTFRYRGEHVRADDRDGARAYILKEENYSFDISGNIHPGLNADNNNQARSAMPKLPWMISVGPQLNFLLQPQLWLKFGIYPTISTDFSLTKASGLYFDARIVRKWKDDIEWWRQLESTGFVALSVQGASQEHLATYYEVSSQYVNVNRAAYDAKAGFLSYGVTVVQALSSGLTSVYIASSYFNYDLSVNKQSPLHRSDHNFIVAIGLNYTLKESKNPAVSDGATQGILNEH